MPREVLERQIDHVFELIVLIPQIAAPGGTVYQWHSISIFRTSVVLQSRNLWPKSACIKQINNEQPRSLGTRPRSKGIALLLKLRIHFQIQEILAKSPPFSHLEIMPS